MSVDVERVAMEAASKPQSQRTQVKKCLACVLIGVKIVILIHAVAMLCLSAILPEGVTWEHIWCEGEPNKNCAGFMQFPIIFSGVMVLVAVSSIIAIACDWSHPVVIWVDVAVSIAAGVIWIAVAAVVAPKTIRARLARSGVTPTSSERVLLPNQWMHVAVVGGIFGSILNLIYAVYRIRQYCVLRAKPTPWAPPINQVQWAPPPPEVNG